jgi:uncharacterized repeat protein (TIGR03803 family)
LYSFSGPDGAYPRAALIQATDGGLYGTSAYGGAHNRGTILKITTIGTLTSLYSFCSQTGCTDGLYPAASLVQATDGSFYGTTYAGGGISLGGTVFRIDPASTFTTLDSFCGYTGCVGGSTPVAPLIKGSDGDLYGANFWGPGQGWGTLFKITPNGELTTLYGFCAKNRSCLEGANPDGLIQAIDGDFYGTTLIGGLGTGTIFKMTPSGTLTTLHRFCALRVWMATILTLD